MALVSPGVEVTIIDESQYLPTAVTSVPFILLATAQDKANGSGTGVAPATTKANANKLFTVTSQRDLVSLYGNPFFYKTTDGTPIQGYELNEYGLLAAYSLLGTTNRAFILRADIDLAALVGQVTRPTGAPVDGTFWLDTTNSTWGIQEWNLQTGTFTNKIPFVITEPSQTVQDSIFPPAVSYIPSQDVGNIGDYAIVQIADAHYSTANVVQPYIFYKAGGDTSNPAYNTWIIIGVGTVYKSLYPVLTGTLVAPLATGQTFYVRGFDIDGDPITYGGNGSDTPAVGVGAPITIAAGTTVNTLVASINNQLAEYGMDNQMSVSLNATSTQLIWTAISDNLDSITYSAQPGSTILQSLGITTAAKSVTSIGSGLVTFQAFAPLVQWGTNAQTPRWRSFDATPRPTGSVFLKSNNVNNGTNLVLSQYATATQVFTQQLCNLYGSDAAAINTIDPTGGAAIPLNTTYALYNPDVSTFSDSQLQIFKRSTTGPITYTGSTTVSGLLPGEQMLIQYTTANNPNYSNVATITLPTQGVGNVNANVTLNDLITAVSSAVGTGAPVVAGQSLTGQLTLTHSQGGSILISDQTRYGIAGVSFNQISSNVTYTTVPTITFADPLFNNGTIATALASGSLPAARLTTDTANVNRITFDVTAAAGGAGGWLDGEIFTISTTSQPALTIANVTTVASYQVSVNSGGDITAITLVQGGAGYTTNLSLTGSSPIIAPIGRTRSGISIVGNSPILLNSAAYITSAGSGYANFNSAAIDLTPSTAYGNVISGGRVVSVAVGSLASANVTAGNQTIVFGGGTSQATGTANVSTGGTINSITITSGGAGYGSSSPLTITSIGGSSQTGTQGTVVYSGLLPLSIVSNTQPFTVTRSTGLISKTGFGVGFNGVARFEGFIAPTILKQLIGVPVNTAVTGGPAYFDINTNSVNYTGATYGGPAGVGTPLQDEYTISGDQVGGTSPANDITVYYGGVGAGAASFIVSGFTVPIYVSTLLSGFTQFTYVANEGAPVTLPANNAQWYYSVIDEADIMIQDNGIWQGYRNVTMDSRGYNLTQTDPNGPIIATDAPTLQSDGTALVYGDLWIDSNDLENYPAIYRWENVNDLDLWVPISNADQTTQSGVLFQDARWAGSATVDPINDPVPTIVSMLTSNYTDPDAPSPTSYPEGILLFNTRRSGYNIKEFRTNYFTALKYPNANPLPTYSYTWVSTSGLQSNGAPYMGRKAQRNQVVKALKASIATNMSIREEDTFFNLMATPNYCELQPEMVVLNNDRNNTAYIVGDTPLRLPEDATAITAWATNAANSAATSEDGLVTRDTYMGIYYPSGITTDLTGSNVVVPPSHMMLRTILRNDQIAYPWFAPAGTRRGNIDNANNIGYIDAATGEFIVTKTRLGIRDVLYTNFINPLTFFTNVGLLNYGNKNSRDSQSSLDRTNVARLIAYLRERLTVLARPFVFEPNDAQTRRDISGVVTTLMADVLSKRGIYDYLVVCDTTNNTPARIDRNELWIDVALEPAKAVEFIYIPVRILNTGEIAGLGQNG
jgi:hypothetical protein